MSQQNIHPTVASLPSGMHARAATIANNPGYGHASPAFGPARAPLVQVTLEQARGRSPCRGLATRLAAHHAAHRAARRAARRATRPAHAA